jgi:hypothetical protein
MVKFEFGKRVTPAQQAAVDERLAEAAKAAAAPAAAAPPTDTGASDAGARPGVSDAVSDRLAEPDLADAAERLGAADGATSSSGDGPSDGGRSGSSESAIGSIEEARAGLAAGDPTGLTAVTDQLAARRPVADLTQGPERQDPFEAIADAQAGLPGSALREGVNSLLSDAASRDDGVTGIAEQGADALAKPGNWQSHLPGHFSYVDGKMLVEVEDINGHLDQRSFYDAVTGELIAEQRGVYDPKDFTFAPSHIRTKNPETGEITTRFLLTGEVQVTRADGSKLTTQQPTGEYQPVAEPMPMPPKSFVRTPDDDSIGDEFRHVSEGLQDRLGPRGGGGDGHTDPVDDGGVGGPITESALPDVQDALLGGDPRLGGVVDGSGTSGFRAGLDGLDSSRGAGTVRNPDEEFLGGGLEDDPLDDLGRPGASPGSGSPLTETSETAAADGDDPISAVGSMAKDFGDSIPEELLFGSGAIDGSADADTGSAEADEAAAAGSSELVDPIGLFADSAQIDQPVFGLNRPLLAGFRLDTGDDDGDESSDRAETDDET